MVPTIRDFGGAVICGVSERFTMDSTVWIPVLWDRILRDHGKLLRGERCFGACFDTGADMSFQYLVGVEDRGQDAAKGLERLTIPAGRFAVFSHRGHIATLPDTWERVFSEWVPRQRDWALAPGPQFERWEAGHDSNEPGGVEIWVPVVPI